MRVITIKRIVRPVAAKRNISSSKFRQLAAGFFASETKWQFAIEALLFAIIAIASAWPLFAAADALNQYLRRT